MLVVPAGMTEHIEVERSLLVVVYFSALIHNNDWRIRYDVDDDTQPSLESCLYIALIGG